MNRTYSRLKWLAALAVPAAVRAAAPGRCGTSPPGTLSGSCPPGTDRVRDVTWAPPQGVCAR